MKIDAVPGKQNIFRLMPAKCGVYYGICAELCGVNHSYMPIVMEVLRYFGFQKWEIFMSYAANGKKG